MNIIYCDNESKKIWYFSIVLIFKNLLKQGKNYLIY